MFDMCKLKIDLQVEVTDCQWNKSRVADVVGFNGYSTLWVVG